MPPKSRSRTRNQMTQHSTAEAREPPPARNPALIDLGAQHSLVLAVETSGLDAAGGGFSLDPGTCPAKAVEPVPGPPPVLWSMEMDGSSEPPSQPANTPGSSGFECGATEGSASASAAQLSPTARRSGSSSQSAWTPATESATGGAAAPLSRSHSVVRSSRPDRFRHILPAPRTPASRATQVAQEARRGDMSTPRDVSIIGQLPSFQTAGLLLPSNLDATPSVGGGVLNSVGGYESLGGAELLNMLLAGPDVIPGSADFDLGELEDFGRLGDVNFSQPWHGIDNTPLALLPIPPDCFLGLDASQFLANYFAEGDALSGGNMYPMQPGIDDAAPVSLPALNPMPNPEPLPSAERIVRPPPIGITVAKKHRRENDGDTRDRIKKVRQSRACMRCRIYKESCDLNIPCGKCVQVLLSAKLFKQPCQRISLDDVVVFRQGNARAGETRSTFPRLLWSFDYPETRKIWITYNIRHSSGAEMPRMPIACRQFIHQAGDVLEEPYEAAGGQVTWIKTPPFACLDVDTPRMRSVVKTYLQQSLPIIMEDILATTSEEIYRLGLIEASRFAKQRKNSAVSLALETLSCVHINVQQPIIVGQETLGILAVANEKLSTFGKRPVPSVLDYQIDTVYIHHMQSLMKQISKRLKDWIFGGRQRNRANWYQIFLATFVLLVSLERVHSAQMLYIRRSSSGGGNLLASVGYVSRYMIAEWRASAKNLLYHFRCILRGMTPFCPGWDPRKEGQVNLDDEATIYIQTMTGLLDKRRDELASLREEDLENSGGTPLVWLMELFLD